MDEEQAGWGGGWVGGCSSRSSIFVLNILPIHDAKESKKKKLNSAATTGATTLEKGLKLEHFLIRWQTHQV